MTLVSAVTAVLSRITAAPAPSTSAIRSGGSLSRAANQPSAPRNARATTTCHGVPHSHTGSGR
ncbi:hypothetical protein [Amycolatopsis thermoflava]|uniref:hypothetical protein n=1 Tax=Amycolatopsis thermoflava TaxID=84480 RepID=UPI000F4BF304|nr:hypothetical protein [Amycolatopsis thermoflava]